MQITLYGIPNCDSVKKARSWLQAHGCAYAFHDVRKDGLDATTVNAWLAHVDWESLVNKKGTTWRALPDADKAAVTDAASARALMLATPSVIKRPVACAGSTVLVGFDAATYQKTFTA